MCFKKIDLISKQYCFLFPFPQGFFERSELHGSVNTQWKPPHMVKLIYIHTLRLCCWGLPLLCLFWHHYVPHSSHSPSQCPIQHFLQLPSAQALKACPMSSSSHCLTSPTTASSHAPCYHHIRVFSLCFDQVLFSLCFDQVPQTWCFWGGTADLLVLINIWDGQKEEWGRAQSCTMNHESVRPLFSFVALNNWQSSWDLVCFLNHINKICQLDVGGQQHLGELGAQIPLT